MRRAQIATFAAALIACSATMLSYKEPARAVVSMSQSSAIEGTDSDSVPSASLARTAPNNQLPEVTIEPRPHPLETLNRKALINLVQHAPQQLGSVSLGIANRGALYNGIRLPEHRAWKLVNPAHAWATQETIEALERTFTVFHASHPETIVYIGDLSKRDGGYLRRHRSHQSGRDVDIGYVYQSDAKWYTRADANNLDRARTWALIKAFLSEADVEYIFIERPVQDLLREHALAQGEDAEWLDSLFDSPKRRDTVIRNARGHTTHFHVRFHNNIACETARRLQAHVSRSLLATARVRATKKARSSKARATSSKHVRTRARKTHTVRRSP